MPSNFRILFPRSDAAIAKHQDAELVRTLGWVILALTTIPALFTSIGIVAGSLFWLWWTVGQVLTGAGALALSAYMYARAARPVRAVYRPSVEEAEFAAENYQPRAA